MIFAGWEPSKFSVSRIASNCVLCPMAVEGGFALGHATLVGVLLAYGLLVRMRVVSFRYE